MNQVYWLIEDVLAGRCGPCLAPWNPMELAAGGIQAIISLDQNEVIPEDLYYANIHHLPLYQPMLLLTDEKRRANFLECMPEILDFIDQMRAESKPVMVHCFYGCDRTGAILACYLIAREGYTAEQAIARVQEVRPEAMLAEGYREVVYHYEAMLRSS